MPKISRFNGATHTGVTIPNRSLYLTNTDLVVDGALVHTGTTLGLYGAAPAAKPTVAGGRDDPEEALASALDGLVTVGLVTDSTTVSGE